MNITKLFGTCKWANCVGFSRNGALVDLFSTQYREEMSAFMLYVRTAKREGGFPEGAKFYLFGSDVEIDEKNIRSEEVLEDIFQRGEVFK